MNIALLFFIVALLIIFIIVYRSGMGDQAYQFLNTNTKRLKLLLTHIKKLRKK